MKTLITIITIFLLTFSNTFALNSGIKIGTSKIDKIALEEYNKTKAIVDKINNSKDVSKISINDFLWIFNKGFTDQGYDDEGYIFQGYGKEIKKAGEKYLNQPLFGVNNAKFLIHLGNVGNILEILNDKTKFDKLQKFHYLDFDKGDFYGDIYRAYIGYDEKFIKDKSNWETIFDGKEDKERKKVFALDKNKERVVSKEEIEKKLEYSTIQSYRINDYLNKLYATNLKSTSGLKNRLKKDYSSYSKDLVNSNQLSKIVKDIVLIEQYKLLYDYHVGLMSIYKENLRARESGTKTIHDLFGN